MRLLFSTLFLFIVHAAFSQNYNYYYSGDTSNVEIEGLGGVCLMGGATEDDNAMIWFLNQAENGNILVLRASGTDGYQNYLYTDLGVNVASVETIVLQNANAGTDAFILDRIAKADAIWFAGGDQFEYKSYLKDTPAENLLNAHVNVKNKVVGGTSAGMAILGNFYFDAANGSVTSAQALDNPFHNMVSLDSNFFDIKILENTITDTHFDNPDRKGRLSAFIARLVSQNNHRVFAIACEEYTAVCIDENGIARVFGESPEYIDKAYFIQSNCEGYGFAETLIANTALTYNNNQKAMHVLEIDGTYNGTYTFNLNDWISHTGGTWKNWYVENGVLEENDANAPNCALSTNNPEKIEQISFTQIDNNIVFNNSYNLITITTVAGEKVRNKNNTDTINVANLPCGVYVITVKTTHGTEQLKWFKTQ